MKKKISVTTAIPYVNGKPHIGHVADVLFADVLARHHRSKGDEVFFLTGTDEHGQKNLKTAKEQNKDIKDFVTEMSEYYKQLNQDLNISYDRFIRTEDPDHIQVSQNLWQKLKENDDIYHSEYEGLYCVGCEAYLTTDDLDENGLCPIHLKKPEKVKEKNYFFRLSKYSNQIYDLIKNDQFKVVPSNRKNEILSFIKQELKDTSFSRPKDKLPWGILVPDDPDQVMYVWCDALTNYLTGISNWDKRENEGYNGEKGSEGEFWPPTYQVIGKDILRFHAAIWPAMLLSAKLDLPKYLIVHGFFNVKGQKMSKTVGNIIDPQEYIKKYSVDALRYYVFHELPLDQDGDFSEERFINLYNADLANNLGNLIHRVINMAIKYQVKDSNLDQLLKLAKNISDYQLEDLNNLTAEKKEYDQLIEEFKFQQALEWIWQRIDGLNRQIDQDKPWQAAKLENQDLIKLLIGIYLFKISLIAVYLEPFLPETSQKINDQLSSFEPRVLFSRIEE